jgi:hypothetical protein
MSWPGRRAGIICGQDDIRVGFDIIDLRWWNAPLTNFW